jgi:hypothetical protein
MASFSGLLQAAEWACSMVRQTRSQLSQNLGSSETGGQSRRANGYMLGTMSADLFPQQLRLRHGESNLVLAEAIGMTSCQNLFGGQCASRPLRVWYWNLEDPPEETERRIAAIMLHYKIAEHDIAGRLFVNSEGIVIGETAKLGTTIYKPVVAAFTNEIIRHEVDVGAEKAEWRKLVSVPLDNGTLEDPGDWIGVAIKWDSRAPSTGSRPPTY